LTIATSLNTLTSGDDERKDKEISSLRSELEELREVNESQSATIQQLEKELKKYVVQKFHFHIFILNTI
jgi:predicted RNase H-like nuclease (RuvC/YqgF family)